MDDRFDNSARDRRRTGKSLFEVVADRLAESRPAETVQSRLFARTLPPPPANAPNVRPFVHGKFAKPAPTDAGFRVPTASNDAAGRHVDIDIDRLRSLGFVIPGEESTLTEEFRLIKRPLLQRTANHADPRANAIMVTSAAQEEGKSFTAVNLALSLASERDHSVLLVDADLMAPSLHGMLSFEADFGLADLLLDPRLHPESAIAHTNIANLSVLPAGRMLGSSNELFASARMADLIVQLLQGADDRLVVFDSPPVLARSEAAVLAEHMGQIVFVVEAGRTSGTAVKDGLAMLSDHSRIGMVLNKVTPQWLDMGYGSNLGGYAR